MPWVEGGTLLTDDIGLQRKAGFSRQWLLTVAGEAVLVVGSGRLVQVLDQSLSAV